MVQDRTCAQGSPQAYIKDGAYLLGQPRLGFGRLLLGTLQPVGFVCVTDLHTWQGPCSQGPRGRVAVRLLASAFLPVTVTCPSAHSHTRTFSLVLSFLEGRSDEPVAQQCHQNPPVCLLRTHVESQQTSGSPPTWRSSSGESVWLIGELLWLPSCLPRDLPFTSPDCSWVSRC